MHATARQRRPSKARTAANRKTGEDRISLTEDKILGRLVAVINQGRDPQNPRGQSPYSLVVAEAGVSRATFYRHSKKWTWDYLLDDLLTKAEPAAADRLAEIRGNPTDFDNMFARIRHLLPVFLPSGPPQADVADLRLALNTLTEMVRQKPRWFLTQSAPGPTNTGLPYMTYFWRACVRLMWAKADEADLSGEQGWAGVVTLAEQTAGEIRRWVDAAGLGQGEPLTSAGEFGQEWAYAMVRSGMTPSAAVRTVAEGTWRRTGPGFQASLWVSAAQAILNRHSLRRQRAGSGPSMRSLDDQAVAEAIRCFRRGIANPPLDWPEDDFRVSATAQLLVAADRHEFSREHPLLKAERAWLAAWVQSRPFDCAADLSRVAANSLSRVAAVSALVNPDLHSDPTGPYARYLRRFIGQSLRDVGRRSHGVAWLRDVPPRMVTVLVEMLVADRHRASSDPRNGHLLRYLLGQLHTARLTEEWNRLPAAHRQEWEFLLSRHRAFRAPDVDARTVSSIQRDIRNLEAELARRPRVGALDYAALSEAADRLAGLVSHIRHGPMVRPTGDATSAGDYWLPRSAKVVAR